MAIFWRVALETAAPSELPNCLGKCTKQKFNFTWCFHVSCLIEITPSDFPHIYHFNMTGFSLYNLVCPYVPVSVILVKLDLEEYISN